MADAPDTMRDDMDGTEPHGGVAPVPPVRSLTDADADAIAAALLRAGRQGLGRLLARLAHALTGESNLTGDANLTNSTSTGGANGT